MKFHDEAKLELFVWAIIFYAGIGLVSILLFGLIDLLFLLGFGLLLMIVAYFMALSSNRMKKRRKKRRKMEVSHHE